MLKVSNAFIENTETPGAILLLFSVLVLRAVRDLWLHGSLFAGWRSRLQLIDSKFAELLICRRCLTYHLCWIFLVLFLPIPGDVFNLLLMWMCLAGAVLGLDDIANSHHHNEGR